MKSINEFALQFCPKKLFKYRSFDSDKQYTDIIEHQNLFAPPAIQLNDPFDCTCAFDINKVADSFTKRRYHMMKPDYALYDSRINKKIKEITQNKLREKIKVLSLSGNNNSLLMWSHYASNHEGFCIEIDANNLSFVKQNLLYPVIYSKKRFDITKNMLENDKDSAGEKTFLFKSKEWEYEDEWRIICANEKSKGHTYDFSKSTTGIYLGANISEENMNYVLERTKDTAIKIYKMYLSDTEYTLKYQQLIL